MIQRKKGIIHSRVMEHVYKKIDDAQESLDREHMTLENAHMVEVERLREELEEKKNAAVDHHVESIIGKIL